MSSCKSRLANLLCACALIALAACGGGHSAFAPQPGDPGGGSPFSIFPPPAELLSRQSAFTEQGLMRRGAAIDAALPHNLISTVGFSLNMGPSYGVTPRVGFLSYATYRFDVSAYDRDLNVRLAWSSAPAAGTAYIGLANFTKNKWDWQPLPANNILDFAPLGDYSSQPGGELFAVVLLTGTQNTMLDSIRVGTQPTPGNPNADLQADVTSGPAPLQVNFDASASAGAPPATIAQYEFDYGEGVGWENTDTIAAVSHTYAANGTYSAQVRVTDVFGAQDTASVTITVGPVVTYSEVENNDTQATANALPAFPFTGFTGSYGTGPGYPGYDGDAQDWLSFIAAPGDSVTFTMTYDNAAGELRAEIVDAAGITKQTAFGSAGTLTLPYDVMLGDIGPFAFHLLDDGSGQHGDYSLAGSIGPTLTYDEVENNDDQSTANTLPALPVAAFRGNVGTGGVFDGDTDDWVEFTVAMDDVMDVALSSAAGVDIEIDLYDNTGRLIVSDDTVGDNSAALNYTAAPGDTAPFALNIHAMNGAGDYTLSVMQNAPSPQFGATPDHGPAPLAVNLDASGSFDDPPGTIATYEFDYGEGAGFGPPQASPADNHIYAADGAYTARVRLTDNQGNTAIGTASVTVNSYDEVEDNDSEGTPNFLAAFPVIGFRGNCGPGGSYDGDLDDYFSCIANTGELLDFTLTYAATADLSIELLDSAGNFYTGSFSGSSPEHFQYTLDGTETQPMILHVLQNTGQSDYVIDGFINPPTAALTANPNQGILPLNVTLDASASTDIPPGAIASYEFDFGDGAGFGAPQAGATIGHQYTTLGLYTAKVRVTDDQGNWNIAATSVLAGVTYGEVENNDDFTTPNTLPAFPVTNFLGSHGAGAGYPGYDGDMDDYFGFSVNAGDTVTFTLNYDNSHGEMSIDLYDSLGDDASFNEGEGYADGSGGVATITYVIGSDIDDDGGPYTIRVWDVNDAHYGDYILSATKN